MRWRLGQAFSLQPWGRVGSPGVARGYGVAAPLARCGFGLRRRLQQAFSLQPWGRVGSPGVARGYVVAAPLARKKLPAGPNRGYRRIAPLTDFEANGLIHRSLGHRPGVYGLRIIRRLKACLNCRCCVATPGKEVRFRLIPDLFPATAPLQFLRGVLSPGRERRGRPSNFPGPLDRRPPPGSRPKPSPSCGRCPPAGRQDHLLRHGRSSPPGLRGEGRPIPRRLQGLRARRGGSGGNRTHSSAKCHPTRFP